MLVPASLMAALAIASGSDSTARIAPNDNTKAAGQLRRGVLTLQLDAIRGTWAPEGEQGPRVVLAAFSERGRPVQIPGPLIRVPAGTEVRITIRNRLGASLLVRGFYDRGAQRDSLDVAPGAAREVRLD